MEFTKDIRMNDGISLGIDIGSTTAKIVIIKDSKVIYSKYERHFSQVRPKTLELVKEIKDLIDGETFNVAISGSAGLGMARSADLPFVQEVFATAETVKHLAPETDVVIELGGEDAKVIFFKGGMDERMNGTCAGGTGAFIDQMATLLDMTVDEMDKLSLKHTRIYPIASRCGVFAKTDIQPLLNQGAMKENIAASIYTAVVNQTIAGLAQGRKIDGKVMFLGGPLYYCQGLRNAFVEGLHLTEENALFPEYGRFSVSVGAAIYAAGQENGITYSELVNRIEKSMEEKVETGHSEPLFADEKEYEEFRLRHSQASVETVYPEDYEGDAYIGIDCGSTTTKLVLLGENGELLFSYYDSNKGNPVEIVRVQLREIYSICKDKIKIKGSAVTGYGEELIRHAFHVDGGLVETMAHFTAAKHFNPNVDFILDIGGQDIKCFKIKGDAIDRIMLNEACSSGCGSFIETFAKSMGYDVETFSKLGLMAKAPADLGSRCTVFMNSSVKQAQKDGVPISDISAGLSMSVVKNAIYKVIRANSIDELGSEIVVQGGTFLNDAVLRSFEMLIGKNVIRPQIAGLMGAYGAALYARSLNLERSSLLDEKEMESFTHTSKAATCNGCTNHCHLTINTFNDGQKYISGNKCEKGSGKVNGTKLVELPNLHQYKRDKLLSLKTGENKRGRIGLPLALGMYELAPLWNGIFTALGYEVVFSKLSDRALYTRGQYSIPSDTACYPAKIMHGHIEYLVDIGIDAIFYPCLSYNFDEKVGDNHYNCPVVAYYSELLSGNMETLRDVKFLYPYLNINSNYQLARELYEYLSKHLGGNLTLSEVKKAVKVGMRAYDSWMEDIRQKGKEAIEFARANGKRIMILAGRPYHADPEIGHGIDKLATSLGYVVVSEDSVASLTTPIRTQVLNQWTYHARLYNAAKYASYQDDMDLVQLVSFGCGLDAVTTDEVRSILESRGKLYTQIKIDEITNLGAVNIRLRSLLGAIEYAGLNKKDNT
ncbi:MAG: acyl-CoA dehydratase activase [Clostridia bacterium]|nr:acyl-CoA dehydratase activase [Clostridia bacterium]